MSFNSSQLKVNFILLVLLGIYNNVDVTLAHQCYVCGPEEDLSCDNFDPANKSFIKECPSAKSCSIAYGKKIERSCVDLVLQDCQTANNIRYCYCSENLCNDNPFNISDDEDLTEEGSGITVINNPNTNQIKQKSTSNVTNQSNRIESYLYTTYITILTFLCN